MKKSIVRIGLFGVGHFGKLHLKNLLLTPFEFVGFYDPNNTTTEQVKRQFNVPSFDSAEALMEAIDAADIVAPTRVHMELADLAYKFNKHMFIEKPIAAKGINAQTFVEKIKGTQLKVQVGQIERFNPAFKAVQSKCSLPHFIEAKRLAPFNPRGNDVSVIHDLMIHDIDAILSLVNDKVIRIDATGKKLLTNEIDICEARLEFENGCVANIMASRIHHEQLRLTTVFGDQETHEIDYLKKSSRIISRSTNIRETSELPVFQWEAPRGVFRVDEETLNFNSSNAILDELNEFYNSIVNDEPTKVDQKDALRALLIAEKIHEITMAKLIQPV